jgi:elongation factor G
VETAAVVASASAGIEMITSRMMDWAAHRKPKLPSGHHQQDRRRELRSSRTSGGDPVGFRQGVLSGSPARRFGQARGRLFFNPAGDADFSSVEAAHRALVDQVVEADEEPYVALSRAGGDLA